MASNDRYPSDVHIFGGNSKTPIVTLKATAGKTLQLEGQVLGDVVSNDGHIFKGDASNVAQQIEVSGDITLSNDGVATLATVNASPGSTVLSSVTTNEKGLVTATPLQHSAAVKYT